jgi:hypothetical protein
MQCELFEYNDEDFDTGIETIQLIEEENAFQYAVTLDSASVGYTIGETVEQELSTYTMRGEVTDWSDSDKILQLAHVGASDGKFHTWVTNAQVKGLTSLAVATPSLVAQLQNIQADAQNTFFDDFESDFLDFSESNPFGDIQ